MVNNIHPQLKAVHSAPPAVDGDHTSIRGMMANLNCWLARSLDVLKLFDAINKSNLAITGELAAIGQNETDQITALSGDNAPGLFWTAGKTAPDAPNAPGLNYWLTNGNNIDSGDFGSITQGIQAHISDVQLKFNNQTSAVQTKADEEKDTSSDVEQGDTSLLQSMTSGLISGTQNLNSIRLN